MRTFAVWAWLSPLAMLVCYAVAHVGAYQSVAWARRAEVGPISQAPTQDCVRALLQRTGSGVERIRQRPKRPCGTALAIARCDGFGSPLRWSASQRAILLFDLEATALHDQRALSQLQQLHWRIISDVLSKPELCNNPHADSGQAMAVAAARRTRLEAILDR